MRLTRWEREQAEKRQAARYAHPVADLGRCFASRCKRQAITGMHCEEHERAFWTKAAASIGKQAGWSPEETKQRGEDAAAFYVGRGAKR